MEKLVHGGKYRHFKGMEYRVIKEVEIEGESLVLYQKLYDDYSYWLRPVKMFLDYKDGAKRFVFLEKIIEDKKTPKEIEARHSETEKLYKITVE